MTLTTEHIAAHARLNQRPFGLIRHSLALAGRSVVKTLRTPKQLIDVTLQPILFLIIYVLLLAGAVSVSTEEYLQFLLPAIMVQTVMFGGMATGVNLNTDIKKGVFDRFRSLPIAHSAPLIGSILGGSDPLCGGDRGVDGGGGRAGLQGPDRAGAHAGRLPADDLLLVLPELGLRAAGGADARAGRGAGHLVRGAVPADVRHQHDHPQGHSARLAAGLAGGEPGQPRGGPTTASEVWTVVSALVFLVIFAPLAVAAYRRRA